MKTMPPREARKQKDRESMQSAEANFAPTETNKDSYLRRKKENADARKLEKRKRDVMREIEKLEEELSAVSDELYGDAASDYIRAAELDARKTEIEERLLDLYEEEETL